MDWNIPQRARFKRYECWDERCQHGCRLKTEMHMELGLCEPNDSCDRPKWINFECEWDSQKRVHYGKVSIFENPGCHYGYVQIARMGRCYKDKDALSKGEKVTKYYKWECGMLDQELRESSSALEKSDHVHMNIGIVMAVFSIVCMIGFFFGYVLHRKRTKYKTADMKLPCDVNNAVRPTSK